jgi:hypothetical protein
MMPKQFPLMHISDMYFYEGDIHASERISDRDASMCEGTRVDDYGLRAVFARGVDTVDNTAFVVGLIVREGDVRGGALCRGSGDYVGE